MEEYTTDVQFIIVRKNQQPIRIDMSIEWLVFIELWFEINTHSIFKIAHYLFIHTRIFETSTTIVEDFKLVEQMISADDDYRDLIFYDKLIQ